MLLLISDSSKHKSVFTALADLGIKIERVPPTQEALHLIPLNEYVAVIIDSDLHPPRQLQITKSIRARRENLPVLILTCPDDVDIRNKQPSDLRSFSVLMNGDEKEDLSRLLECLKRFLPELTTRILGMRDLLLSNTPSKIMNEILALADILKDETTTVLIQGESGTGKEIVARLLHFSGRRHQSRFVAINCAAIPETLLESELFGHEKGSFTGATEKRIGKFELAHRGTIFLDELGDMPLSTQAKILRVLETGEVERVGGHERIPVDIRIVAATNKNVLEQIEKRLFRQDLYYRINTFTLNLPPLRERKEDILPLAKYFLDMFSKRRTGKADKHLSEKSEMLLMNHTWPGNVRELRNAMERATVLTPGNIIEPAVLPDEIRSRINLSMEQAESFLASLKPVSSIASLEELEKIAILEALSRVGNNVTKASRELGISKATLFRKLKKYGISRRSLAARQTEILSSPNLT